MAEKLIDSYKRKIDYLRLSVTDRCNLRCIYCMPKEGIKLIDKRELLTFEEIIRVVKILSELGIKKVRITGGEPLLRENILGLIDKINKLDAIEDISLTTNGTLLSRHLSGLYRAGIKRLNISLDSLDPNKYKVITRGGEISRVLDGIFGALKMGFKPVKINVVITHLLDEKDILDIIKLSVENPISIRFIEAMPVVDLSNMECGNTRMVESDDKSNKSLNNNYSIDKIFSIMGRIGDYYKIDGPVGYGPAVYYKLKGSIGSIGFIFNDKKFCRFCNRIRLTPRGTIKLCLFSKFEFDIKTKIRNGASNEDIKKQMMAFIKKKPKNRDSSDNYRSYNDLKIPDYMSQIGG